MLTGRELIIYILENNLEDEPIFEDGKIIGFMNETDAAVKFGVGTATIRVWINEGLLDGFRVGESILIPRNSKNPKEIINNEKDTTKLDVGNVPKHDPFCRPVEHAFSSPRNDSRGYRI